jgi:thiol-disulfide isomerase/thioredoxin
MSTRALIGLFVAATAGLVIFLFVSMSSDPDGSSRVQVGARTAAAACNDARGECLPALTWVDTNGTRHTPESLAGKVVVVNFWATWCKPCEKEIPDFSKVAQRYQDKAVILGVLTTDNPSADALLNFMSDHDMTYPVVRATPDILLAFDYPAQLPTTFVFDARGNAVLFDDPRGAAKRRDHLGAMSEAKLSAVLDRALRGSTP